MNPLEFSALGHSLYFEALSKGLEQFRLPCHLNKMAWEKAWDGLIEMGLYRLGADVSQVGSTWLDGIMATNGLRPFTGEEVDSLGGASAFLPALWKAVRLRWGYGVRTWAIPWLSDVRVVAYWRDMLEQAGVDAEKAFETPEQVEETMERLSASRVEAPWGLWASTSSMIMQNASSWIWGAGGDYLSGDGKRILFDQPEVRRGLVSYLKLHRYMPPGVKRIGEVYPFRALAQRRAAIAMGTMGSLPALYELSSVSDAPARIGVTAPPGPAFVGGSVLVIWRHTRRERDALELVRFLTDEQMQSEFVYRMRHLPVRLAVLDEPPYSTDPLISVPIEALKTGRTYPVVPRWGFIEKRFTELLVSLWNGLMADPDQDVEALVASNTGALVQRLAATLGLER